MAAPGPGSRYTNRVYPRNAYYAQDAAPGSPLNTRIAAVETEVGQDVVVVKADSATLALTDRGKIIEQNKATAQTLTVPTFATVALPVGSRIRVVQTGAGLLTFVAAGGVTINVLAGSTLISSGVGSQFELYKTATNTWELSGDLSLTGVVLTQTFATADPTLVANTSVALTDSTGGTPDTTVAAVPAATAAVTDTTAASLDSTNTSLTAINGSLSDLTAQHNKLLVDFNDLKAFVNSLVDALQAQPRSGVA